MNEIALTDRIAISRQIRHGQPHITGTRIAVYQVLDMLAAGKTPTEITSEDYYPDLTLADVLACIAYASTVVRNDQVVAIA